MPDTYTQIIIQFVFAVKGRQSLIAPAHQEAVNKYITGIVKNKRSRMLAVNGMPDHLHILIGLHPSKAISDLVGDIKADSNEWTNKNGWVRGRFLGRRAHSRIPGCNSTESSDTSSIRGAPCKRRVSESVAEIRHRA